MEVVLRATSQTAAPATPPGRTTQRSAFFKGSPPGLGSLRKRRSPNRTGLIQRFYGLRLIFAPRTLQFSCVSARGNPCFEPSAQEVRTCDRDRGNQRKSNRPRLRSLSIVTLSYKLAISGLIRSWTCEAAVPRPANVVNLMDALRRSVATEKAEAEPTAPVLDAEPKPAITSKTRRKAREKAETPAPDTTAPEPK
jgi:hypothetical protein